MNKHIGSDEEAWEKWRKSCPWLMMKGCCIATCNSGLMCCYGFCAPWKMGRFLMERASRRMDVVDPDPALIELADELVEGVEMEDSDG